MLQISSSRLGPALVGVAAVLWATVGIASGLARSGTAIDPLVAGTIRTALGGAMLLVAARVAGRVSRVPVLPLLWFGVGCAVFQVSLFHAFAAAGVTVTVAVTVCCPPLLVALWDTVTARRAPGRALIMALAMAVTGVVMTLGPASQPGLVAMSAGAVLSLAVASVAFAVVAVAARPLCRGISPVMGAGAGLSVAAVLLAGCALATGRFRGGVTLDPVGWAVLLYIGLVATGLAYLCFAAGMRLAQTASSGLVASMVEPTVAALLAALVLNERLDPMQGVGCGLVLLSMLCLARPTVPSVRLPAPARMRR